MSVTEANTGMAEMIRILPRERKVRAGAWFVAASFIAVAINALVFSYVVSGMAEHRVLQRDAAVSAQFVNSIVRLERATSYFSADIVSKGSPEMEAFFRHVADLPDVLGANVYSSDRTILWSSDESQIGKRFTANPSLEAAFRGELHPKIEGLDNDEQGEGEHVSFPANVDRIIETYIPIWSEAGDTVVGAVEVYRSPVELLREIGAIRYAIWLGSAIGASVLFATLTIFMIIVRRMLAEQERRLVEAEKFAVVGELTSAVAHGLRNPLAAIRSSAELAADDELPEAARGSISDIIMQTDRLEGWIRSFLLQARETPGGPLGGVLIDDVLRECADGFSAQAAARGIALTFVPMGPSPRVRIKRAELCQIINSIIANSIEAIGRDGEINLRRANAAGGRVELTVEDNGPGIAPEVARGLFRSRITGKASGLGVGLPLTRRILDRCGGTIDLVNREIRGARATLTLPAYGVNPE